MKMKLGNLDLGSKVSKGEVDICKKKKWYKLVGWTVGHFMEMDLVFRIFLKGGIGIWTWRFRGGCLE